MATRKELIEGVGQRYRGSGRQERREILAEFVRLTGYHRKHAIRVLNCELAGSTKQRTCERIYDEAVRQALIVLWEAADRICSKRLKAALPLLIVAMERHGHLALAVSVRQRVLTVSSATIDRLLYLHYVFDLWVQRWRVKQARGDAPDGDVCPSVASVRAHLPPATLVRLGVITQDKSRMARALGVIIQGKSRMR